MSQQLNQFVQAPVKGQLDLRFNPSTISCQVHSTQGTALVPGQAVKMYDDAGGVPKVVAIAADTDVVFGIVPYSLKDASFAAGASVEISLAGNVLYMEAGAAIARGAKVMPVVSGSKIATATGGKTILGIVIDKAASSGDLVRVLLSVGPAQAGVAASIAALGTTTDLTAIAGSYADLAAARTSVNTLRTDVEARLDAIEAKIDAILVAIKAAGLML